MICLCSSVHTLVFLCLSLLVSFSMSLAYRKLVVDRAMNMFVYSHLYCVFFFISNNLAKWELAGDRTMMCLCSFVHTFVFVGLSLFVAFSNNLAKWELVVDRAMMENNHRGKVAHLTKYRCTVFSKRRTNTKKYKYKYKKVQVQIQISTSTNTKKNKFKCK